MERKKQFAASMQRLSDYFGISITPEITRSYYDQLYYIDQQSFEQIVSRIIADRRPFKSQFPIISEFGPLYESEVPEKALVEFVEQECDECKREGLIYYKYWNFEMGLTYTSFVACSQCNNWKKHFNTLEEVKVWSGKHLICKHPSIPRTTKEQLCMQPGILEVSEDGVFRLTKEQLTDRVMEFYGERNG